MVINANEPPKIKGGYYIKARCITDSWIAHSAPVVRETWDYLLREANHKERKYNGHIVKRGQLFRTYKEIRDGIYWMVGASRRTYTANQMKHTMKLLANNLMIKPVNHPRGVLITICNYEYYQNPKNYESTTVPLANIPASNPPIIPPSPSINKNGKELKNDNKNPKPSCANNNDFEVFYKAYPKKKNKPDTRDAWDQVFYKPKYKKYHGPVPLQKILDSINDHKNSLAWTKDGGQFIPGPAAWLRAHGFNDPTRVEIPQTDDYEPHKRLE